MCKNPTPESREALAALGQQIAFVLDHPHMSDWIKHTLTDALRCSPIEVLNDLEILNQILRKRAALLGDAAAPDVGKVCATEPSSNATSPRVVGDAKPLD